MLLKVAVNLKMIFLTVLNNVVCRGELSGEVNESPLSPYFSIFLWRMG